MFENIRATQAFEISMDCNLKLSSNGLECVFHNQVIKFILYDFKHHLGLVSNKVKCVFQMHLVLIKLSLFRASPNKFSYIV